MELLSKSWLVLLLGLGACATGAGRADDCDDAACGDDDDATGGGGASAGAGAGTSSGSGAESGSASGGTGAGGPCDLLCGAPAAPSDAVGRASFVPAGCDGAGFTRSFVVELPSDGAKAVPQLADVDGDGKVDLVLNARLTSSALVLPGDGQGSFGQGLWLPSGGSFAGGWGVDLGDFDGDGALDVAAGDHASGALAWRNQGAMSFALANGGLPETLYNGAGLGDVDGDGDLDVLFGADQFSSGLALFLGDGAGSWSAATAPALSGSTLKNAGHLLFADHDLDGDQDLFAFGQTSGPLTVLVLGNDGTGTSWSSDAELSAGTGNSIGNPVQGSVGDVDCDGALDVAAGGTVYRGAAGGWQLAGTADESKVAHLGDMNGDGFADLVTHLSGVGLRLFLNDGTGSAWTEAEVGLPDASYLPPGVAADAAGLADGYGIDLGDVNGDGKLDIARVLRTSETGTFSSTSRCFVEVWVRQ